MVALFGVLQTMAYTFEYSNTVKESKEAVKRKYDKQEKIINESGLRILAGSNQETIRLSSDVRGRFEQEIREWLNDKDEIKQAALKCISVNIQEKGTDTYIGTATFDNGEQVPVEVGKKGDSGELYFRADLPALVVVMSAVLPGYEHTTIGKAFDIFFADPNWITRIAANGAKFVELTGRLKKDLLLIDLNDNPFSDLGDALRVADGITPSWSWKQGDQICIRFAISYDGDNFEIWSVQRGNDQPIRTNDSGKRAMLDKLLEAIYELK